MNELSIFDSLFNDVLGAATPHAIYTSCASPRVDVIEDEKNYTLEMELPGRSEKDVNIEVDHDNLTISSVEAEEKEDKKNDKKEKYILRERRTSEFKRRFTLPQDVDSENISASFKNGVLTIFMQKKPIAAPKKITIAAC